MNQLLSKYDITFAHPEFFWMLLLLPLIIWFTTYRDKHRASVIRISTIDGLKNLGNSWKITLRPLLTVLKSIAFLMFIVVIARPQKVNISENIDSEGIDIVLSMDISGSMLAEDFKPNRIESAKKTAIQFIEGRKSDRIGLVIFAGESFTQCPITIDHNVLKQQIAVIKSGLLEDGTAIGMGLATAVDRLRDAKGKSRVIILMTDGVNNVGRIDPLTALEIAKVYKVRVYTIGIGTQGEALYPVQTPVGIQKQMMPVQIDEALLQKISAETGGRYYRATGSKALQDIYKEIDQLERTKIEIQAYKQYAELFFPFALIGIIALLVEVALRHTIFRTLP
jgi:Ca-activated chloride channel family protein